MRLGEDVRCTHKGGSPFPPQRSSPNKASPQWAADPAAAAAARWKALKREHTSGARGVALRATKSHASLPAMPRAMGHDATPLTPLSYVASPPRTREELETAEMAKRYSSTVLMHIAGSSASAEELRAKLEEAIAEALREAESRTPPAHSVPRPGPAPLSLPSTTYSASPLHLSKLCPSSARKHHAVGCLVSASASRCSMGMHVGRSNQAGRISHIHIFAKTGP